MTTEHPATPPEIPAAALTPPGGDTTLDEAVEAAARVHARVVERCDCFEDPDIWPRCRDHHRAEVHEMVAAAWKVFTARHAAEVEAARLDGWNKGVRRGQDGHPAAEQRGREQAVQAIEARYATFKSSLPAETEITDRLAVAIFTECIQLARGATPTPAGGEAKEPYWTGYQHALAHLIAYRSGAGWGPAESAEVQADADTWAASLDGAIDTLSRVLRERWFDPVTPAQQLRDLLGEGSPFTAMLPSGGAASPSTITPTEFVQFDADVASCRMREPDTAMDGAAHSVWLHGKWRWLTQQMTTPEREAFAAAVVRFSATLEPTAPVALDDLRWWSASPAEEPAPAEGGAE